jgi:hypothetical protein
MDIGLRLSDCEHKPTPCWLKTSGSSAAAFAVSQQSERVVLHRFGFKSGGYRGA